METATINKNILPPQRGKIFVILGKAASGKTECSKDISKELNIEEIISCTSRPPRLGEIDEKHYYFLKLEDFKEENFLEMVEFNGWKYGIRNDSIEDGKNYIVVSEPHGYRILKEKFGDHVVGIYIMASYESRWERYIARDGSFDEAIRRFKADEYDFKDFEYESENVIINNKEYKDLVYKVLNIISWEIFEWQNFSLHHQSRHP